MGLLIEGKWSDDERLPTDARGAFQRVDSIFRERITADGSSGYPAVAGRYTLLVAYGCPWAHRTIIFRKLKRLESAIPMIVSTSMGREGWIFTDSFESIPCDGEGKWPLHRVYSLANPTVTTRCTVPVLWDSVKRTIVNNESSEIIRMFDSELDALTDDRTRYCPEDLRAEIDALKTGSIQR